MKISIIIPVYNVEKYLKQCVDSVLAQSYQNIEIILIDDGSTDRSSSICDDFSKFDRRVIVVHKENGGLSDARNCGIKKASGDYIIFLDSDDFFDDVMALERLVKRIQKSGAEVLNYSYKKYFEESGLTIPQFDHVPEMNLDKKNKNQQLEYLCSNFLYIASACNKMIHRSVFERNMMFEKGKLSEDIEWCARLLIRSESLDFICENFYCYRQRQGSITHTMAEKSCYDLTENVEKCIELGKNTCLENQKFLYMYSAYQYSTFFIVQSLVKCCPKSCMKRMEKNMWLLKYHGKNKKIAGLYFAGKLLGFNGLCKAIRITRMLRS